MRVLFLLIAACALPFGGSACSCIGEEDVSTARRRADGVFIGRVIRAERFEMSSPGLLTHFQHFQMRYTFAVERMFKGRALGRSADDAMDTLVVFTGLGGGDCGVRFEVGQRYVVYGADGHSWSGKMLAEVPLRGRGIYWTSICTRTRPYEETEVKALED